MISDKAKNMHDLIRADIQMSKNDSREVSKLFEHKLDRSKNSYPSQQQIDHRIKMFKTQNGYKKKIDKGKVNKKTGEQEYPLRPAESYLLETVNTSNKGYVSEKGEVERWVGGIDENKMKKKIKKNANTARKTIKKHLND